LLQSSLAAVVSNLPNLDALLHRTMLREMQQHSSLEEAGFTFLGSKPASSLPQPSFAPPLVLVPVSAVASPAMRNRGSPGSSPWGSPGPSALGLLTPSLSAANAPLFAGRNGAGQRPTHGSAASTPVHSALAAHAPLPPSPLASLARLGPSSALQFGVPWPVEERRDALQCAPAYGGGDAADAVESAAHENGATVRRDAELQQQQDDEGEDENEQDDASVSVGSDVEEDDGAEEEDEQQEQIDSSGDSDDDGDEAEEQR